MMAPARKFRATGQGVPQARLTCMSAVPKRTSRARNGSQRDDRILPVDQQHRRVVREMVGGKRNPARDGPDEQAHPPLCDASQGAQPSSTANRENRRREQDEVSTSPEAADTDERRSRKFQRVDAEQAEEPEEVFGRPSGKDRGQRRQQEATPLGGSSSAASSLAPCQRRNSLPSHPCPSGARAAPPVAKECQELAATAPVLIAECQHGGRRPAGRGPPPGASHTSNHQTG